MIKIEIIIGYAPKIKTKISIYFFKGPTIPNRRDQCASFEPLVDYFGPGPPTHDQPRLSGLVVGVQTMYNNHAQADPEINACQDPAEKNGNN